MMNKMIRLICLCLAMMAVPACMSAKAAGPRYLGQKPPGMTPELFAPGVVNTEAIELNGVFSPDGREFFFTRIVDGVFTMYRSVLEPGGWSDYQQVHPYEGDERQMAVDMAFAPDGNTLYFLGRGSTDIVPGERNGLNLWSMERRGDGWTKARVVPPPVSTEHRESYPCVVADGSLYFSSNRPGGLGEFDIYRAQRKADGTFAEPVNVGPPINTEKSEGDTYVALDESYLIVAARRPDGLGQGDLYVSFRGEDGRWGTPHNLGAPINSDQTDFCPMVTPDGAYLFFSRRWGATWDETTEGKIYWVSAKVLDQFRPR